MAGIQGQNQLTDFLRALRRRRWQVFVPASLVISVGVSFAVIVPKKYRLSTRVEIASEAPLTKGEAPERREAVSVADHIRHYTRVKEVIERELVLHLWPEYENASGAEERARFIKDITERNLSAAPSSRDYKSGTIFIDIAYSDENVERAARFLEDLTTSWLQYVADSDRESLLQERARLQEIVDGLAADLKVKDNDYYKLMKQLDKDPSTPERDGRQEERGDWTFEALGQARTDLSKVEVKLSVAKLEYEQAELHYQAEPEYTDALVQEEAQDLSKEIEAFEAELAVLEEQIANLRPSNSQYRRLAERIATVQGEIEELKNTEPESTERTRSEKNPRKDEYLLVARAKKDQVDLMAAESALLQTKIEELERETQARTESYQRFYTLKNDAEEARKEVNATRAELAEREKALAMLDASPRPWRIAQQPLPSSATVTPNPWLISAFSVFAGLALGMGLAVLSEYARSSYRTVGDLAAVMSVPVLGAIETIVTRRELRKVQLGRAVAGLSTAMIVGSIGWVTYLWYSAPERLPIEVQDAIEKLRSALK